MLALIELFVVLGQTSCVPNEDGGCTMTKADWDTLVAARQRAHSELVNLWLRLKEMA